MENVIVIILLIVLVASILWYLIRAKKRGGKCIGCPYAKQCGSKDTGDGSCQSKPH